MTYKKIAALKTAEMFLEHLESLGVELPFESEVEPAPVSPLAQEGKAGGLRVVNRFTVLPMEGWDGTPDGLPSPLTVRRWQRFGQSGAGLVWGGEAAAVRHDGRANPNQLLIDRRSLKGLAELRETLVSSYQSATGSSLGPVVGLQLTYSGRYARPNGKNLEPRLGYDHPLLNARVGLPAVSDRVLSDGELDELVETFIDAAALAQEAGFQFVDVKLCHGYLGHELLSAVDRPGKYGGSLENRTRFPREIIRGIRERLPGLAVGVRLSVFDFVPFRPGEGGVGRPDFGPLAGKPYRWAFGGDGSGLGIDLAEPLELVNMLDALGVKLICLTAGSPYYNPHIQRPAYFPPSDGYLPPEDPLVGVARQLDTCRAVKTACPGMFVVGSALTALQDWLPNVVQAAVRQSWIDSAGLGRMMLAYPELPADVLAGRTLQRKRICRTFSDCTTAPRGGMVSGCYPLDPFYKERPEVERIEQIKQQTRAGKP